MKKLQKSYLLLAIALLFSFTSFVNAAEEDDINALLSEIVSEAEGETATETTTPTQEQAPAPTVAEPTASPSETNGIELNSANPETTTVLDSANATSTLPETGPTELFIIIATLLAAGVIYFSKRKSI